ncbi:MAG: ABC transporter permease [Planctomycetota bacterium]
MLTQILGIARNTLVEALRQPIYMIVVLVSGLLQYLNTATAAFAMGYTTSAEVSGDDKLLLDVGLATVFLLGMLLAAFESTAVISREIQDKTVLSIISKPVPRAVLIIGKFIGVATAIVMATLVMIVFLLWGIRHGVMSTASDEIDWVVVTFSLGSVGLSMLAAGWCNFFYNWSFPQVTMVLMPPLALAAYLATLAFSPEWEVQSLAEDFKPQVTTAAFAMLTAVLVLASVATAASTRLGQVMTIVACAGVFLLGLLSNHFFGRHALTNRPFAEVLEAVPLEPADEGFDERGATYRFKFQGAMDPVVEVGAPVWYGPNPNGVALAVPEYEPYKGSLTDPDELFGPGVSGALVVAEVESETEILVRNVGARPLDLERTPELYDFVFQTPTSVNAPAFAVFSLIPNMHYFWLLDAVTQNRPVPNAHLALIGVYTVTQVGVFLSLAVLLFETRDVG